MVHIKVDPKYFRPTEVVSRFVFLGFGPFGGNVGELLGNALKTLPEWESQEDTLRNDCFQLLQRYVRCSGGAKQFKVVGMVGMTML